MKTEPAYACFDSGMHQPRRAFAVSLPARCVVAVCAAALQGCSWSDTPAPPSEGDAPAAVMAAFLPTTLRLDPLTHVALGPDGTPRLIAHVELRDAWGDSTKAFGMMEVRLYVPDRADGLPRQQLRWEVNLSDFARNAALFDPATRTYRLPLAGVPAWMASFAPPLIRPEEVGAEEGAQAPAQPPADGHTPGPDQPADPVPAPDLAADQSASRRPTRLVLQAIVSMPRADGTPRVLSDEIELQRPR